MGAARWCGTRRSHGCRSHLHGDCQAYGRSGVYMCGSQGLGSYSALRSMPMGARARFGPCQRKPSAGAIGTEAAMPHRLRGLAQRRPSGGRHAPGGVRPPEPFVWHAYCPWQKAGGRPGWKLLKVLDGSTGIAYLGLHIVFNTPSQSKPNGQGHCVEVWGSRTWSLELLAHCKNSTEGPRAVKMEPLTH